jgi:hypothetical protein
VFSIDWLRGAIPVEKEICALATKDEAIAAAKTRGRLPAVARGTVKCYAVLRGVACSEGPVVFGGPLDRFIRFLQCGRAP